MLDDDRLAMLEDLRVVFRAVPVNSDPTATPVFRITFVIVHKLASEVWDVNRNVAVDCVGFKKGDVHMVSCVVEGRDFEVHLWAHSTQRRLATAGFNAKLPSAITLACEREDFLIDLEANFKRESKKGWWRHARIEIGVDVCCSG